MKAQVGWATGIVVFAWLSLAIGRAWQVGASPSQVALFLYAPVLIVLRAWLGCRLDRQFDPRLLAGLVTLATAYIEIAAIFTNHPGRGAIGYANANAASRCS